MSDIVERLRNYAKDYTTTFDADALIASAADLIESQAQRIAQIESALEVADAGRNHANELLSQQAEKVRALEAELERERMRLAACSTAALGYFDGCMDEYKSASLDDVLRLKAERDELKKHREALLIDLADSLKREDGLKHDAERSVSWIDGVIEIIELYRPETPSQIKWKKDMVAMGYEIIQAHVNAAMKEKP